MQKRSCGFILAEEHTGKGVLWNEAGGVKSTREWRWRALCYTVISGHLLGDRKPLRGNMTRFMLKEGGDKRKMVERGKDGHVKTMLDYFSVGNVR